MESQPEFRGMYRTTAWLCIAGIGMMLTVTALEVFYFAQIDSDRYAFLGCGLAVAGGFAIVWPLSWLGRFRLTPTAVALVAAIAGTAIVFFIFSSWLHELGEVIFTGQSSYRGAGNWRGVEIFFAAIAFWVFGIPGFLVLYGVGWLISAVVKKQ